MKGTIDGPGDFSMQLKYRLLGANEQKGNYSVSAALAGTAPTGSYKNGAADGTITPTLFVGKGFGPFDVQTAAERHSRRATRAHWAVPSHGTRRFNCE